MNLIDGSIGKYLTLSGIEERCIFGYAQESLK